MRVETCFFWKNCGQDRVIKLATVKSFETSALKFLTVANLRYQLSWWYLISQLYSPTDVAPQFLWRK